MTRPAPLRPRPSRSSGRQGLVAPLVTIAKGLALCVGACGVVANCAAPDEPAAVQTELCPAALPLPLTDGAPPDDPDASVESGQARPDFVSEYERLCSDPTHPSYPLCSHQLDLAFPGPNTDANCTTAQSNGGQSCNRDCIVPCGFGRLGMKRCTCLEGEYDSCDCDPPQDFERASSVPRCSALPAPQCSDGRANNPVNDPLMDPDDIRRFEPEQQPPLPCSTAWQACIGSEPGATGARGCVCLPRINPLTRDFFDPPLLAWDCGATNGWL